MMGKTIFFSSEVDSTNLWAKQLASSGVQEGTITIAETQSNGRGRLGRRWYSPMGGLWFSVVLRPKILASQVPQLTVMAALSVIETLHGLYDLDAEAKWPNDVLVNERKVCGILGEASLEADKGRFVIIGIGLNANFSVDKALPVSIASDVTSLETEMGHKVCVEKLLAALLKQLEIEYDLYLHRGFSDILAKWKAYAKFLGRRVDVSDQHRTFRGIAEDVDANGVLVVRLEDGSLQRFLAADISLNTK